MQVKTATGTRNANLLEVTPENFIVPKGEEQLYHCRIEVKKFNAETGERLSKPAMQTFGRKFFESFGLHNLKKQGYTVDIMHNPKEWEMKHREEIEAAAKAKAEAAAAAAAAAKAEADAKLREEIKREVMEELAKANEPAKADTAEKPKKAAKE